jgi:flagellar basal-body rod modification protein FlgD
MAAAAAGIFNHQIGTAAQAFAGKTATPMDSSTNGTSGTDGSSDGSDGSDGGATISANDFLTLLVTEMQNQDPTADTDPNEYINQLVEVNSLEQLIDINQTLTTDLGGTASSGSSTSSQAAGVASGAPGASAASAATARAAYRPSASPTAQLGAATNGTVTAQSANVQHAAGNLNVPRVNRAAQRVGHALDGRTRAQPIAGSSVN